MTFNLPSSNIKNQNQIQTEKTEISNNLKAYLQLKEQQQTKPKKKTLTKEQFSLLKEAFDLYDIGKESQIEVNEMKLILKAFEFKSSIIEFEKIISNSKTVSFEDYIEFMTIKFNERDPKTEAILCFDLVDTEKKGKIGIVQLKAAVKQMEETVSDEDLYGIIEEFDSDCDGFITKEEFIQILDEYYFD